MQKPMHALLYFRDNHLLKIAQSSGSPPPPAGLTSPIYEAAQDPRLQHAVPRSMHKLAPLRDYKALSGFWIYL